MITVKQMKNSLSTGRLLSNFDGDFWLPYKNNNSHFDNYFSYKFSSFVFFDQNDEDSIDSVTHNFICAVYDHLLVNNKRYSELFRVNVVPDDESYSIVENYYLQETFNGSNNNQSANITGQRTDVSNTLIGEQNGESISKNVGHNTSNENLLGSTKSKSGTRNDVNQFTQGKETDTSQSTDTMTHNLVRHGAIGTMTASDVLEKQLKLWENCTAFYDFVFNEIAKSLLLIGD